MLSRALLNAIEMLRASGCYHDDEGDDTDALAALADAIAVIKQPVAINEGGKGEGVAAASWFALVDGAAATPEQAANRCGALDSEEAALGAAKHYRERAQDLFSTGKAATASAAAQPSAKALTGDEIAEVDDRLRACHRWHAGDSYAKGRVEHASALLADHSRDVTKLTAEQPSADKREAMFYVQDTRQFVGNCVMWWGKNRSGYVTRINEAGKYTLDEVSRICERDIDRMWPCEQIDALAHPTVDMQHLPRKAAQGETK